MDDWDDFEPETTRVGRRVAAKRTQGGLKREERFIITLAVTAALMLVLGLGLGFAFGRSTAPKPAPAPVVKETTPTAEATPTPFVDPTVATEVTGTAVSLESEETTEPEEPEDTEAPETPDQLAPDDGDRIDADKVTLKWSKVTDDSGKPVKYAFEIQTRVNGEYTNTQVIDDLEETSYKARVLVNRRRWRVWAVDAAGNKSEKSGWHYYQHTPEPERSSESTGN